MLHFSDLTQGKARRYRWMVIGIVAFWVLVDAGLGRSILGLFDLPWAGRVALIGMLVCSAAWFVARWWWARLQRRQTAARAGRCAKCGYRIRDLPSRLGPVEGLLVERPTCPECGHRQWE